MPLLAGPPIQPRLSLSASRYRSTRRGVYCLLQRINHQINPALPDQRRKLRSLGRNKADPLADNVANLDLAIITDLILLAPVRDEDFEVAIGRADDLGQDDILLLLGWFDANQGDFMAGIFEEVGDIRVDEVVVISVNIFPLLLRAERIPLPAQSELRHPLNIDQATKKLTELADFFLLGGLVVVDDRGDLFDDLLDKLLHLDRISRLRCSGSARCGGGGRFGCSFCSRSGSRYSGKQLFLTPHSDDLPRQPVIFRRR